MPILVLVALVVASFVAIVLLKAAFGLIGWIIGNLVWILIGASVGYYYGKKKSRTRV